MPRRARWVALLAAVMSCMTPSGVAAARPVAGRGATAWQAIAPAPALPFGTRQVGQARGQVSGVVGLRPRDPALLARFATAVSTPGSPDYRRYLARGGLRAAWGPTPGAVHAVEHYLTSRGITVRAVTRDGLLVDFRGPVAAVASAFRTRLATFAVSGGREAIANISPVALPAAVAADVAGVVGLDGVVTPVPALIHAGTSVRPMRAASAGTAASVPAACPAAGAVARQQTGWTDAQLAGAYGVDPLLRSGANGAGQTVALFELEPYLPADIRAFDACYFGATAAASMASAVHTVPVDGGSPAGPGVGEAELDIENISAFAPGAAIDVYEAPMTAGGYLDEWNTIIQNDTAATISTSWSMGACESQVATADPGLQQIENTLFEEAAAQGQTILAAAGDSGSDSCAAGSNAPVAPYLSVSDPASQPYVTGVGGTSVTNATNPPAEQAWNDGAGAGAGGGGFSAMWPAPAWQLDRGVPGALPSPGGRREVPDVSASADEYRGITIYHAGGWTTAGGTSSAAPLWAAMLADADSTPACRLAGSVGFANPVLYSIASVPAEYAASFNDVTVGNNDEYGANHGQFAAGRGYDMATGLGSPRLTGPGGGRGLAYYLCQPPSTARPTVSSITPQVIPAAGGGPVTLTVTGSHFEAAGAPDVAGVTVGTGPPTPSTVVNDSTLTVAAPALTPGDYDVTVTLVGGQTSAASAAARLTVTNDPSGNGASVPVVAAVSPSGGNEAGGTVVHVYGSGFTALGQVPAVTIGGVAATVLSATDTELSAVVPPFAPATACATHTDPSTDVCQAQVQVSNGYGPSSESTILPELSGPLPPPGSPAPAGTETAAAPTEFDYLPTPAVTGFTFLSPGQRYASQEGFSFLEQASNLVQVSGTGLGTLGLQWFDVGRPGTAAVVDAQIVSDTPTQVELALPSIPLRAGQVDDELAAQTLASPNQGNLRSWMEPSAGVPVTYAPVPTLRSVTTRSGKLLGPDSGGTTLTVTGRALEDGPFVAFASSTAPTTGTDYGVRLDPSAPTTRLTVVTTPQLAGLDHVDVCTVSGCGGDRESCVPGLCVVQLGIGGGPAFAFYPPGKPSVTSISPRRGPAGTIVTLTGSNLALPEEVVLGAIHLPAGLFANGFDPNTGVTDTNVIQVVIPPSLPVGRRLAVRVATAESVATQAQPLTPPVSGVMFTRVVVHRRRGRRSVKP